MRRYTVNQHLIVLNLYSVSISKILVTEFVTVKVSQYLNYDMVKRELRLTSYELRVESLKARVEIQKCEFKSTSYEFESTSYEFKSTSCEFESTSYEFESILFYD